MFVGIQLSESLTNILISMTCIVRLPLVSAHTSEAVFITLQFLHDACGFLKPHVLKMTVR
jgi:hypothetical protein